MSRRCISDAICWRLTSDWPMKVHFVVRDYSHQHYPLHIQSTYSVPPINPPSIPSTLQSHHFPSPSHALHPPLPKLPQTGRLSSISTIESSRPITTTTETPAAYPRALIVLKRIAINVLRVDRLAAPRLALVFLRQESGEHDAYDEPEDGEREDKG